ncbi:retention module-containing protein, partial [Undibacterium sp. Di24W]|uniref:retention module-containing protein n=1 Tax=Undibacterium sp. Di24W TaxID=3413033 RepID=UPI003BF19B94
MANSTSIIGKVVALQGQAIVKSPDGKQHQLKVGDVVYEKDVIITMPGAQVELAFDSGHSYSIRQNETLSLDASVFAPAQVEVANAALLPQDASAQNIANAVVGENSLDKLLEETAAGLGGGDVGDGNSFVRIDRIAENVTPSTNNAVPLATASPPADTTQAGPPADGGVQVLSVSSPSAPEGGSQDFVVKLSGPSAQTTQLNLALSSGSATVGVDTGLQLISFDGGQTFVGFSNGNVAVPAGVTSIIVRVAIANDGLIEGTESLSLAASTASNTGVVTGSGVIIDSVAPTISIAGPLEVSESAGVATFTVTLSSASTAPVSVNYATTNGTAIAGSDFTAVVGSIVFAPGETNKTISVPITADRVFEGAENFSVNLSNPSNAVVANASSSVTIRDSGLVVDSVSDATVAEGGNLVFTVSLNGTSTTPTLVNVNAASGTATLGVDTGRQEFSVNGGASWSTLNGPVTVPPGVSSFQVRIATLTDNLVEGAETLTLSAGTSQNISPAAGTGTITESTLITVSISGPGDVNEGAGTVSYTISLSAASQLPVTVNYGTSNGTALAGSDYSAATGSITFAPGETSKTITVSIINDSIFEGPENFNVSLSAATNATIATGNVGTTIHDDGTGLGGNDDDRIVVVSVSSPTVVEGNNLVFTVSLNGVSAGTVPVSVNAASGSATLGLDTRGQEFSLDGGATWSTLTGSVAVPAGVSNFLVRIPTVIDGLLEGDETLSLAAATAQNTSPVIGIGTITDGAVSTINLSGPVTVDESAGTISYTISLSAPNNAPVSVNYTTNNGTALAGSDYTSTSGSVTFAPGEISKVITVSITDDLLVEDSETFQVKLSGAINAALGADSVTTTIIDNDEVKVRTVEPGAPGAADNNVIEGNSLVYTVSLSAATTSISTFAYSLGGGTATAGADYNTTPVFSNGVTLVGGNVIVPSGVTAFTVTVSTIDDTVIDS